MCDQTLSSIALPLGWPDSVRSAVIYVISLAHYAIAYARGWAANSIKYGWPPETTGSSTRPNCSARRAASKTLAWPRSPRTADHTLPPTERMATLELKAARTWSLAQTAKVLLLESATVAPGSSG